MIRTKIQQLFLAVVAIASLAACSQNTAQVIKGASIKAEVQNGDIYADLVTHVDSNQVQILALDLPIFNPKNPAEQLGEIKITTPQAGLTDITLALNVSKVAKLQYVLTPEKTLPNGTLFPVIGVDTNSWYSIPLNNSKNSKLYVNIEGTSQKAVVGYALVSDKLSAGITANIFTPFAAQGVSGYGGVFSGITPGASGIAVFADISSVLKAANPSLTKTTARIRFWDKTTEAKKKPLYKHLIDLNLKDAKLKFK